MKRILRMFWFPIMWKYYIAIIKSSKGGLVVYPLLIHLELSKGIKRGIYDRYLTGEEIKLLIMEETDIFTTKFAMDMKRKMHKITKRRVMISKFSDDEAEVYFDRVEIWRERVELNNMMDRAEKQFKETA